MRKRVQRTVPVTVSQSIGDEDLLRLIRSLDDLVEAYPEVPNLCAIANPGGQLSGRETLHVGRPACGPRLHVAGRHHGWPGR